MSCSGDDDRAFCVAVHGDLYDEDVPVSFEACEIVRMQMQAGRRCWARNRPWAGPIWTGFHDLASNELKSFILYYDVAAVASRHHTEYRLSIDEAEAHEAGEAHEMTAAITTYVRTEVIAEQIKRQEEEEAKERSNKRRKW